MINRKYKNEKASVQVPMGAFSCLGRLDELTEPPLSMKKPSSPPRALPLLFLENTSPHPTGAVIAMSKKKLVVAMDKGYFWRDYLTMAARAATIALMEEDEEETVSNERR